MGRPGCLAGREPEAGPSGARLRPARSRRSSWNTARRLMSRMAQVALTPGRPTALPPRDRLRSLPLVSMRCALASGVAMLHRVHQWRSTLEQVCDDMNAGLAIFRRDGLREVARNTRWSELVEEEPERVRLLELIRRRLEYTGASAGSLREDYWELQLSGRSYRMTARCAPAGTLLPRGGCARLDGSARSRSSRPPGSCGSPSDFGAASPRSLSSRRKDSPTRPSLSGCG